MNKTELLARAQELNIEVAKGATNLEIESLIKIAEHPQLVKDLKEANQALKSESENLKQANQALESESEKLKQAKQDLETLQLKLNKTEPVKGAIFKTADATFEFSVSNFRFKGEKYTSEEAVNNEVLMAQLIEANCNFLKQI
ncbi:hypothetical protein [Algibacter sp. PT7-4]|uniref:hypothetical protein n=1 Tax=Algibacter ulvanivorans TaxID=3400999 RepID=UPI003AAB2DE6